MRFTALPIPGAYLIEIERKSDERGFFSRTYCADEFKARGLVTVFEQSSVSFNAKRGTLRGLQYQAAALAETKVVRCTAGAAFDVIVDLRRSSPAIGTWHGETISADDHAMMYIPTGCAHGFQTLADATELEYHITPAYVADTGRGIAFDDPQIGIAWPLPGANVSAADRARPLLSQAELTG